MREPAVDRVAVVIPARDEESTVAESVESVRTAALGLVPGITVDVVVVADACSDRTAEVARVAGAHVVVSMEGNVGAARAAGCAWALDRAADERATWIACTDADSTVPPHWIQRQLAAAATGADLVLGTVTLPRADTGRHRTWWSAYQRHRADEAASGHGHVHGANLGVRASAYLAVGGFANLPVREDADLVDRLVATGVTPAWLDDMAVTTSARHRSRVVGGVASDLAAAAPVARHDPEGTAA